MSTRHLQCAGIPCRPVISGPPYVVSVAAVITAHQHDTAVGHHNTALAPTVVTSLVVNFPMPDCRCTFPSAIAAQGSTTTLKVTTLIQSNRISSDSIHGLRLISRKATHIYNLMKNIQWIIFSYFLSLVLKEWIAGFRGWQLKKNSDLFKGFSNSAYDVFLNPMSAFLWLGFCSISADRQFMGSGPRYLPTTGVFWLDWLCNRNGR